jgi:hypothetical protein
MYKLKTCPPKPSAESRPFRLHSTSEERGSGRGDARAWLLAA